MNIRQISFPVKNLQRIVFGALFILCSNCHSSTEPSIYSKFDMKAESWFEKTDNIAVPEILRVRLTITNISNTDVQLRSSCGITVFFYTNSARLGEPDWMSNGDPPRGCFAAELKYTFPAGHVQIENVNIFNSLQNPLPIGTYFLVVHYPFNAKTMKINAGSIVIKP